MHLKTSEWTGPHTNCNCTTIAFFFLERTLFAFTSSRDHLKKKKKLFEQIMLTFFFHLGIPSSICIQSTVSICVSLIMCSYLLVNKRLPSSSVSWLPLRFILSAVRSSCTNARRHDQALHSEIKVKERK